MTDGERVEYYDNKTYRFNLYVFIVFFSCFTVIDLLVLKSWQKNILITLMIISSSFLAVVFFFVYLLRTPYRVGISSDSICFEYKVFGHIHQLRENCLDRSRIKKIHFSRAGNAVLSPFFISVNIAYVGAGNGDKGYQEIKIGDCHEKLAEKLKSILPDRFLTEPPPSNH